MSVAAIERHCRRVSPEPPVHGRSGVYLLLDGDEVVYVGASKDCELRVRVHRDPPATKSHLPIKRFDRALWIPLPERVHPDYEGALIRAFLPKYNQTAPLDRGNDEEILNGFDIGHLFGRDWRPHLTRRAALTRFSSPQSGPTP